VERGSDILFPDGRKWWEFQGGKGTEIAGSKEGIWKRHKKKHEAGLRIT
jgi:hypothetical protein